MSQPRHPGAGSHVANQLRRPVRIAVVTKYVGQLAVVVAVLACAPLGVAFREGETEMAIRYAIVALLLAVLGGLAARIRAPRRIHTNESMVVAALLFVGTPLLMAFPLMGLGHGFVDALFEAVSGVTTTGLSTLATVEDKPRSFLFARAWMQWYGGLGVVVLSIALVVKPGILARRLAVTENVEDDLVGGTRAHARRALITYSLLTVGGAAALWTLGAGGFEALIYSLASVSTGGYAPHDDSLAGLGGLPLQLVVTILCVLGALSLTFYRRVPREGLRDALRDTQLRMLLLLGAVAAVGVTASMALLGEVPLGQALHHGPLLAFSAQSTAGFASADVAELDAFSKIILCLSMAVGGGAGSTAGGLKLLRLLVLVRVLQSFVRWTALPRHAVSEPRIGGHVITPAEVRDSLMILALFAGVVLVSWLAFLWGGHDGIDSLFEVVSATGTVGLSTGVTGPDLATPLKLVLCVDMWMGRLEMIPLLVLLYPGTWSGAMRRK